MMRVCPYFGCEIYKTVQGTGVVFTFVVRLRCLYWILIASMSHPFVMCFARICHGRKLCTLDSVISGAQSLVTLFISQPSCNG